MFVVLWILPDDFDVLSKPLLLLVCGTAQPLLRADSIRFSLPCRSMSLQTALPFKMTVPTSSEIDYTGEE